MAKEQKEKGRDLCDEYFKPSVNIFKLAENTTRNKKKIRW